MDVNIWKLLFYAVFAVWALRSLLTLMQEHKKVHLHLLGKKRKQAKKQEAEQEEQQQAEKEQQNQAA